MSDDATQGPLLTLLAGLFGAILINIPVYSWIFGRDWDWAEGFPFGFLGIGLIYMSTFFHELGHTVFAWFYGYPTLPSFDFEHGGGMAWMMSGQQIVILLCVWATMGYGIYFFREHRALQILIGLLLVFNLATAFNEDHRLTVINFMGPGFEPLTGALLLYRALANLAAPRPGERFAGALFGFGMIFRAMIDGWGLLHSGAHRLEYYNQKGSHGFGDFDKIADALPFMTFNGVVVIWLCLSVASLAGVFALWLTASRDNAEEMKA